MRPGPGAPYGDGFAETEKSLEVFREGVAPAPPAPAPDNLRRPLWLPRAFRPDASAYKIGGA